MRLTLRHAISAALLLAAVTTPARAQTGAATAATRPHVEALASERLQGRQAGSEGERLAAEYLASQLARLGAVPLPGNDTSCSKAQPLVCLAAMSRSFEFTAGSRDGGSRVSVARDGAAQSYSAPDVQALSFSDASAASGDAVFAGYGIVVPDSQNFGYDSYAGLDVAGRIVVVLRYFPEDADPKARAMLARYSDLRYKAMAARQRGAAGLLVVTGPRSPNAGRTIPMTFDTALSGSGIAAVSVSGRLNELLFGSTDALREAQQQLDSGNPHVTGFPLTGVRVTLEPAVVRETRTGRNVLAVLPATTPVAGDKPWIVIGAHYDHLGRGEHGNSLASADEKERAHLGADDNASGAAAVLAIAAELAARPRSRNVLVAFWSAEEIGLVGSSAFVAAPPMPLNDIAAYLNYDMVGRMVDNRLAVQAVGTSPEWRGILERANVAAGFDIALQDDPYQPTDVATFNGAGVPSLAFTTGAHVDYHKPSDTADKINYEDLDRVAALGTAIVGRLMALPDPPRFTKVEPSSQTPTRAGIRVFTGTVPDYTSEAKGLLLGGVVSGGPAEQAGLQKGDVIVEIAGHSIANIYDYTYALELLKIGEPARVVYMRGGERRETTLTPAARQ
jgi:hypothetical protein